MNEKVKKAIDWMLDLARDDSHGYDQDDRWGEYGDYDCSSAVITAYQKAGVPVKSSGATYTGNMRKVFLQCGFKDVTYMVDLRTGKGLQAGDVLLNHVHHTAMYVGDGLEAEASINEFGGAHGGAPGDQTGREILVRAYRNYPWDCVLRYQGTDSPKKEENEQKNDPPKKTAYTLDLEEVRLDSVGLSVSVLQAVLNALCYPGNETLDVDGEFGPLTEQAVYDYQMQRNLDADCVVGKQTWTSMFKDLWR